MIKNIVIVVLLVILVALVAMIAGGKGFTIASPVTHHHTHQEQNQGQISINQWQAYGDSFTSSIHVFDTANEVNDFLMASGPVRYFSSKVVYDCNIEKYIVIDMIYVKK